MSFNLKRKKIAININDQSSLDQYIQMLITELNSAGVMPTDDALSRLSDMNSLSQYGIDSFDQLRGMIEQQQAITEQQQDMQNNMVAPEQEQGQPVVITPAAKGNNKMIKPFNFKKAQFENPMGGAPVPTPGITDTLNDTPELGEEAAIEQPDMLAGKKFNTHSDLNNELLRLSSSPNPFPLGWSIIQTENPKEPDSAQSALKSYFDGMETKSAEQLLDEAGTIYNFIYGQEESAEIPVNYKRIGGAVNEASEIIKKIAEDSVKKNEKKSYNFKKIAQHKTVENAILWGPGQTRIDPFLHQPVSDWHIVERNKGFGLVVDDIWNIDYETIWRENIMDKYSRPYKNKEGDWVGGYLNKRFEIDRNIPVASNMQLKPGQLRKPILPEYGNTESRLQAARASGDIAGAIDISKPFNWKEASSKKKS